MALSTGQQTRFPATDTTGFDTTTGDRTFSFTPAGTPKGIVIAVLSHAATNPVTGVLYGTEAMTLTTSAVDTTEAGFVAVYTLTEVAVPTGTQTVTLQGCDGSSKWCSVWEVQSTTTNGTKVHTSNFIDTTVSTNPTLNLVTTVTTLIYGAVHGGAAAPTSYGAGTNYSVQHSADYGARSARSQRRTAAVAAGTIPFNFAFGTSDDWCLAAVALEEFTLATASEVTLTPATLAFSAVAIEPSLPPAEVTLAPAVLAFSAVALTADPGPTSVTLTPAMLAFSAVPLTLGTEASEVTLTPATVSFSAVALSASSGPTEVTLAPAVLAFGAVALSPASGPTAVTLTPAVLSFSAVPLSPSAPGGPSEVTLTPAVLVFSAAPLSLPSFVTLTPAQLAFVAVALSTAPPISFTVGVALQTVRLTAAGSAWVSAAGSGTTSVD